MKIIFFSQDGQIERLAESLSGDVQVADSQEQVLELLEDVDENDQCLIFLDFDLDKKAVEKFNKKICSNDWILRIIISGEMKVKEFRKHQKGKTSAHGYVLKPLSGKVLKTILNDLEVSNLIEEKELYEEGTKLPDLPREVSSVSGFDSADEYLEEEDDDDSFEAAEFGMNTEVRNLVDLHSVKGNAPPFEGQLNEKIQAKFDQVFGAYEEEDDVGEADASFIGGGPGGGMDLSVKEETKESIALDLGGDDDGEEIDLGGGDDDGGELDLGSDEEEIDLSGSDDGEELDLSADDGDEEIDLGGEDEELDLSGDDEELDLSADDEELDLSAEDGDEEIDLGGSEADGEELDLGADDNEEIDLSADSGNMEQELEDLTANRELPSPEELSEFDEETGEMELSGNTNESDDTGTAEVNAADSELGEDSSEELSMSDDSDDVLEFDTEDTPEEEGELSFSTEPEAETPTQDSEEEGGLDFDLGGIDDEGELETSAPATSEDSGGEEEGGFDLAGVGDDDDDFSLESGATSEEAPASADEDAGGMEMDLGGGDDDFVLEAGGENSEESAAAPAEDAGGMDMDLGDDEDDFDLGDDAVLEADAEESEEADLGADLGVGESEEESEEELSFDDSSDDELDQEVDFGAVDEEVDGIEEAASEVSADSEFDEEELDFAGEDDDEELEKTQAINIKDLGMDAPEEAGAEEMDFSSEGDDESFDDDLDSGMDDEFDADLDAVAEDEGDELLEALDSDDDSDTSEFDADEDLLNDDIGEDTNPTVVMTGDVTKDIEDMVDNPALTNEFRPGDMASEEDDDVLDDGLDETDVLVAEDLDEPEEEESAPAPTPVAPPADEGTLNITRDSDRHPPVFNEGEAVRLQATIRQLREEREELLKDIQELKKENKVVEQENLGLKAELDEAKIEISILKKRHSTEMDEMKYRLRISDEKKLYAEEKARKLQKEFDRLQSKVRMDFNHIKQREKELESQLELVKMDSESQVQSRDKKILELKRKIDQLEFNMENIVIREQKSRDDKMRLEERLERIMKTLRGSIEVLEDDIDFEGGDKRGRE